MFRRQPLLKKVHIKSTYRLARRHVGDTANMCGLTPTLFTFLKIKHCGGTSIVIWELFFSPWTRKMVRKESKYGTKFHSARDLRLGQMLNNNPKHTAEDTMASIKLQGKNSSSKKNSQVMHDADMPS